MLSNGIPDSMKDFRSSQSSFSEFGARRFQLDDEMNFHDYHKACAAELEAFY